MIKALIVEDESKNADTVIQIINTHCKGVEICGHATNVKDAIEEINHKKPKLLILDIQLTDGKSFEILEQIDIKGIKIIFLTAFEEFAIKAIKFSALDYLLKPVNPQELIHAIQKAADSLKYEDQELSIRNLLSNFTRDEKKIVLKTAGNVNLIDVSDIVRCESEGAYTSFFIKQNRKIIVSKLLKEYDDLLSSYGFFRTHQSHLVNLKQIDRYEKADGGYLVLKDGSNVPVATRKKESLLQLFDQL